MIHHGVSQSLLFSEMCFWWRLTPHATQPGHVTTHITPSMYIGIHTCMWVQLLSPNLEDNTIDFELWPADYQVVVFFSQNTTPIFEPVEYTRFCEICVETVQVAKVTIQNTLAFNNNQLQCHTFVFQAGEIHWCERICSRSIHVGF